MTKPSRTSARRWRSPATIPASGSISPPPACRASRRTITTCNRRERRHRRRHQRLPPLGAAAEPGRRPRFDGRRVRQSRDLEAGLPFLPRQPRPPPERHRAVELRQGDRRARLPHPLARGRCRFGDAAHLPGLLRHAAGRARPTSPISSPSTMARASPSSRAITRSASTASSTARRYHLRVRGGLPAADGETLAHPVELDVFVRDRAPWVGFAGNAYVLPAGKGASIPIVSVNTDKAKAAIYRIGDRGARRQAPRRELPPPARPIQRRRHQERDRREALGRRDRHHRQAQRERHHGRSGRAGSAGAEAGHLRHHGEAGDRRARRSIRRWRRNGSSSPISG